MAKSKTSFKSGAEWTGNQNGRPTLPAEIKAAREINKIELARMINHLSFLTYEEIKDITSKNNDVPIFVKTIAQILRKAYEGGDIFRANFILDRMIGRAKEPTAADDEKQSMRTVNAPQRFSFTEFCVNAGYPPPFEPQIKAAEFILWEEIARILLGARGYGKTEYGTVLAIGYAIYLDWYEHKFGDMRPLLIETNLIISKSKTRNTAMIGEIARALEKNGVPLDTENASTIRVKGLVGPNHSVEAIPLKASFRGRHPKRIVMDDPVTEEDVSEAMRLTVKRKYNEAYKLCKNICIIGQPAHAFDLYAELRGILKKLEMPWGSIPELDADLEAMRLAGIDANSIQMSYHLTVPVSSAVPFGKIKYIDKMPEGDTVCFIDPSDGGDYTAMTIGTGYFDGIAVEGYAWQRAWYLCLEEMIPILKARNVRRLAFETNATGTQPLIQLRAELAHLGIGVVGIHSDTNKEAVIMSAGSYSQYIHLSKNSMPIYTNQVVQYEPKAKYDDSPDSLARMLVWLGLIRAKK